MDFNSTVKGSLLEGFYPEGWDFAKIDACCSHAPSEVLDRQDFWNKDFSPVMCQSLDEFNVKMGHEIANEIKKANAAIEHLKALIKASAKLGVGMDTLCKAIEEALGHSLHHITVLLPYSMGGVLDTLHSSAQVKQVEYTQDGIEVETVVDPILYGRLKEYITKEC